MIKSGRYVPTPAIPMPDFAVPYAAPIPVIVLSVFTWPFILSSPYSQISSVGDGVVSKSILQLFGDSNLTYSEANSGLHHKISCCSRFVIETSHTMPKKGAKLGESSLPGPCVAMMEASEVLYGVTEVSAQVR